MESIKKWIHRTDKLVDFLAYLLIILMLLYAGYALWDNYSIYRGTELDGQILKYRPTASHLGLSELQAINPDICAWLIVRDTNIDYPILQAKDNSYYLNRDCYNKYSLGGSVFLDYRNKRDFTDYYSILYGHHMDGGAMFGNIRNFESRQYFDEHKTGTLILTDRSCDLEIFAVLHEDAYTSSMFDTAEDAAAYERQLEYIRHNAVQYREIGVSTKDRTIGMSTCSSATTNGRTIVVARLAEHGSTGGEK